MKLGHLRRKPIRTSKEAGYLLIAIMLMVALLAIVSLARVQSLATELKRDREEELVHRGVQYARAVKKYYKKTGNFPVTLDQLDKTNNMRFLRKRYKDPITGGDFRLVTYAQFLSGQTQQGGLFPGNNVAGGNIGSSGNLNPQAAQSILNAVGFGNGSGASVPSNSPDSSGQSNSGNASSTSNSSATASDKSSSSASSFGSGQTFGGVQFVGVASSSSKVSLKEFDKKNHYKDWMFVYVPQMDMVATNGGPPPLIKGPFLQSRLTGGVGGQNPSLLPNSQNQTVQPLSQSPLQGQIPQTPTSQNTQSQP